MIFRVIFLALVSAQKFDWSCHVKDFPMHGLDRCHRVSDGQFICDCGEKYINGKRLKIETFYLNLVKMNNIYM